MPEILSRGNGGGAWLGSLVEHFAPEWLERRVDCSIRLERERESERVSASQPKWFPSEVILVTGTAGFVGFHAAAALKKRGDGVLGIDCFHHYYPPSYKRARAKALSMIGGRSLWSSVEQRAGRGLASRGRKYASSDAPLNRRFRRPFAGRSADLTSQSAPTLARIQARKGPIPCRRGESCVREPVQSARCNATGLVRGVLRCLSCAGSDLQKGSKENRYNRF